MDVTCVSPIVGFGENNFEVGKATIAAIKIEKIVVACTANLHCFISFALTPLSF